MDVAAALAVGAAVGFWDGGFAVGRGAALGVAVGAVADGAVGVDNGAGMALGEFASGALAEVGALTDGAVNELAPTSGWGGCGG